jgi:hypothetical protein
MWINPHLLGLAGVGSIDTIAQTIQRVEGYYPGTAAYRNNNPGNLRCCSPGVPCGIQRNAVGCEPGTNFAVFPTYDAGYGALKDQVQLDASRGLTIDQFINKYAPSSDNNDPASYGATIARDAGLNVSDPLAWALSEEGGFAGTPGTGIAEKLRSVFTVSEEGSGAFGSGLGWGQIGVFAGIALVGGIILSRR